MLSLRLLVDECLLDKLLVAKLRDAGHDVLTATDGGLTRKSDHAIFEAAIAENRLVITANCEDFAELAAAMIAKRRSHPGLLLVYRTNVLAKEMTRDDIVKAIDNLVATGLELKDRCHKLNDYKY